MITPLKKTALHDLLNKPILFDANIFMVGISERVSDQNCSFENMKQLYIKPLFESFTDIYIHEEVYKELDEDARAFVDMYKDKNVTIVKEYGLYGTDPQYTTAKKRSVLHEIDEGLAASIINEAIRVLKPDGEIIITEWERSKKLLQKVIFFPIEVLEPKPYKSFVVKNLYSYFEEFGLTVVEEIHCDYSKVLKLKKMAGYGL